jgi:hypothetical protein
VLNNGLFVQLTGEQPKCPIKIQTVLLCPHSCGIWMRSLLQELHLSWDSEAARLELDAAAFQGIGKLQRLQSLRVHFIVSHLCSRHINRD